MLKKIFFVELPTVVEALTARAVAVLLKANTVWTATRDIPDDIREFLSPTVRHVTGGIVQDALGVPEGQVFVALVSSDMRLHGMVGELNEAGIGWEYIPAFPATIHAAIGAGVPPEVWRESGVYLWSPGTPVPAFAPGGSLLFASLHLDTERTLRSLVDGGWSSMLPVLAVLDAGTPRQKSYVARLGDWLYSQECRRHLTEAIAPSIVFFVREGGFPNREAFNFHERRPLSGRRIVITRAETQAGEFADRLEEYGAEVLSCPTIEICAPTSWQPLDEAITVLNSYDWIFFTSVNGVEWFWKRLRGHHRLDMRALGRLKVCSIGPATAAALAALNIEVDLIPEEFKAEGVIESFIKYCGGEKNVVGKQILLPRARVARDVLPVELTRLGATLDIVEAYQTVSPTVDARRWRNEFLSGRVDAITFTSSSTVTQFVEMFPDDNVVELLNRTAVACIGPITADTARRHGLPVAIQPTAYTIPGLTGEIIRYFQAPVAVA